MDPERVQWQPRVAAYWEKMFRTLRIYKETHDGDCNVPGGYEFEGVNLGYWVQSQRKSYREGSMDPERVRRLRDLGFDWGRFDDDWEERYELLAEYKEAHGHCNVPDGVEVNDIKLGDWVRAQRKRYKEGKMHLEKERRLSRLGLSWQPLQDQWEARFRLLAGCKEAHGHCDVPQKYEANGIKLGKWVGNQRSHYKDGKMDPEREQRLGELGFKWECLDEDREERLHLLAGYKEAHGHCDVPQRYEVEGIKLGRWVKNQRQRYKDGKMGPERERRLSELGFSLQPPKERRTLHGQQA